jgi:hypothetical protein
MAFLGRGMQIPSFFLRFNRHIPSKCAPLTTERFKGKVKVLSLAAVTAEAAVCFSVSAALGCYLWKCQDKINMKSDKIIIFNVLL